MTVLQRKEFIVFDHQSSGALTARSGFTLLEIVLAILLVGVSLFAVLEAFNRGIFGRSEAEDFALALSLSERRLESLQDVTFASVANSAKAQLSDFPLFSQQVAVSSVHADLKQITVTTYWSVPNGETNTALSTYAANV